MEALGELEGAPRSVIAWSGEVEVFENGYIRGKGNCKAYQSNNRQSSPLQGNEIPIGNNSNPQGRSVFMSDKEVKLLNSSELQNITGLNANESYTVYIEGRKIIEEIGKLSNRQSPGAGCILVRGSKFESGRSVLKLPDGVLPDNLHPVVLQWFQTTPNAPNLVRLGSHGKCAEPQAVSQWLRTYEQANSVRITNIDEARNILAGTKSVAFETTTKFGKVGDRKVVAAEIGDIKPACDNCNPFLEYFGIEEITATVNLNK